MLGLLAANFMITQGVPPPLPPATVTYVDQVNKPIAIAAVMDNSGSLTKQPVAFADMKTGFSNLIGAMKATDIAQVMKFATEYEITQPFTSNKTLLQTAINAPFNKGELTLLVRHRLQGGRRHCAADDVSTGGDRRHRWDR